MAEGVSTEGHWKNYGIIQFSSLTHVSIHDEKIARWPKAPSPHQFKGRPRGALLNGPLGHAYNHNACSSPCLFSKPGIGPSHRAGRVF
jgi:hypothetical protein